MKLLRHTLLIWTGILVLYALCVLVFPHRETSFASRLGMAIQALLFVISVQILSHEPNRKNKFIFLNFIIFFGLSFAQMLYDFVGFAFLRDAKYASFYYLQYLYLVISLSLAMAVAYFTIDFLFHEFRIYQKYLIASGVILVFAFSYFHPFMRDPLYLYSTEDIKQWKSLSSQLPEDGSIPAASELASRVTLQSWHDGVPVGDLYPEENFRRIKELLPYLEGENWRTLLWKPMYIEIIHMNVFMIFFILLFFGYQYSKDPPQAAYFDKIMFLLLFLCSMEIVHNWGYIKSIEWASMDQLFGVGQFITFFIEFLMVVFFFLRLRFITSVHGEFYEAELAANPHGVSRWRDGIDNVVLSQFFNFKAFHGRLFQSSEGK